MYIPDDIHWYIYKKYYSLHVINSIKDHVTHCNIRWYYKNSVLHELVQFAAGEHASKLINNHIAHKHIEIVDTSVWDPVYYALVEAHAEKMCDIFLFVTLKDAIQPLRLAA